MIRSQSERKGQPSFNFPTTKRKNTVCVHCNHRFFLRELKLRGLQIPLLLHCGHAICISCANLLTNTVCPQCSSPQGGVIKEVLFPLHLYVVGLIISEEMKNAEEQNLDFSFSQPKNLTLSKLQGSNGSKSDLCSECGIKASKKCLQCIVPFCEKCYIKIHGRALQHHKSVKLYNIADSIYFDILYCNENCTQQPKYYCNDCSSSYCSECILNSHMKHDYISLKEKNKHLLDKFTTVYDAAQDIFQRIHEAEKVMSVHVATSSRPSTILNKDVYESFGNQIRIGVVHIVARTKQFQLACVEHVKFAPRSIWLFLHAWLSDEQKFLVITFVRTLV